MSSKTSEHIKEALTFAKSAHQFEYNLKDLSKALMFYENAIQKLEGIVQLQDLEKMCLKSELTDQLHHFQQKVDELQLQILERKQQQKNDTMKNAKEHFSKTQMNTSIEMTEVTEESKLEKKVQLLALEEKPTTKLADVVGLDHAKDLLKKAIITPVKHPELFQETLQPFKGFLLFGPPGTGKSYLAKAVAGEAENMTFFSLSASDLVSKYQGESEATIKSLFKVAREKRPSIIFIDEIDSLAMTRSNEDSDGARRIKTELFVQMDGACKDNTGVFTLCATNTPFDLDSAFLRRFDKLIYIPLPEPEDRQLMFRRKLSNCFNAKDAAKTLTKLADNTKDFSGSDIDKLANNIKMEALSRLEKHSYFRVCVTADGDEIPFYTPCEKSHPDAVRMTLDDIPPNRLIHKLMVKEEDVQKCMNRSKPMMDAASLRKLETFAEYHCGWAKITEVARAKRSAGGHMFWFLWEMFD